MTRKRKQLVTRFVPPTPHTCCCCLLHRFPLTRDHRSLFSTLSRLFSFFFLSSASGRETRSSFVGTERKIVRNVIAGIKIDSTPRYFSIEIGQKPKKIYLLLSKLRTGRRLLDEHTKRNLPVSRFSSVELGSRVEIGKELAKIPPACFTITRYNAGISLSTRAGARVHASRGVHRHRASSSASPPPLLLLLLFSSRRSVHLVFVPFVIEPMKRSSSKNLTRKLLPPLLR